MKHNYNTMAGTTHIEHAHTLSCPAVSHTTHRTGGPVVLGIIVVKLSLEKGVETFRPRRSTGNRYSVWDSFTYNRYLTKGITYKIVACVSGK